MENLQIYGTFPVKLQIYANIYSSMNKVTHLCTMAWIFKTPNATCDYYFIFNSDVVTLKSIGYPSKDWEILSLTIQGYQY